MCACLFTARDSPLSLTHTHAQTHPHSPLSKTQRPTHQHVWSSRILLTTLIFISLSSESRNCISSNAEAACDDSRYGPDLTHMDKTDGSRTVLSGESRNGGYWVEIKHANPNPTPLSVWATLIICCAQLHGRPVDVPALKSFKYDCVRNLRSVLLKLIWWTLNSRTSATYNPSSCLEELRPATSRGN